MEMMGRHQRRESKSTVGYMWMEIDEERHMYRGSSSPARNVFQLGETHEDRPHTFQQVEHMKVSTIVIELAEVSTIVIELAEVSTIVIELAEVLMSQESLPPSESPCRTLRLNRPVHWDNIEIRTR